MDRATFIEPMLCLATSKLPETAQWQYELKLDGYRALGLKSRGKAHPRSRNNKDFSIKYRVITEALQDLPDETVIDGEIVAFDESGPPSFNMLQNFGSSNVPLFYYTFDLVVLGSRDLRSEPLEIRREMLRAQVLPALKEPIRYSPELSGSLDDLIRSVRAQQFEGLIAKRRNSHYESGDRSGAWLKMRVDQGQGFVIGGYTMSPSYFDALIFGYYKKGKLIYVGRTRNGFTPSSTIQAIP
jgi:ATP-dependent DNA ligase